MRSQGSSGLETFSVVANIHLCEFNGIALRVQLAIFSHRNTKTHRSFQQTS